MKHNNILGRGLASLIPITSGKSSIWQGLVGEKGEKIQEISVTDIQQNPMQPRQNFDQYGEEELVNSIKEHGIIQPLIVTKNDQGYQLIAGERRLRAAKSLKLKTVPVIVRDASQQQKLEVSLIENIQRQDLNPVEEAMAYRKLLDEFGLTQEQLAKRVGKNRATAANILRLLDLPDEIRKALIEKKITVGHAKVLLSLDKAEDQIKAFKNILLQGLNVAETTRIVRKIQPGKIIKPIDFELQEKEERLREILATKVKIEKRGKGGKIIIEYYSPEELAALINKLTHSDNFNG